MDETSKQDTRKLDFNNTEAARQLFGDHNRNLRTISDALNIGVYARGNQVIIQGDEIHSDLARNILTQLYGLLKEGYPVHPNDVDYAIRVLSTNDRVNLKEIFLDTVFITAKKKSITPKSPAQKEYIDAIRSHDLVFGIGPAGTGKTYLAMAMAVSALSKGTISRIILTRPAVEAGEALGFDQSYGFTHGMLLVFGCLCEWGGWGQGISSQGVSGPRPQALASSVSMWTSSLKEGSTRMKMRSKVVPSGPPTRSFM